MKCLIPEVGWKNAFSLMHFPDISFACCMLVLLLLRGQASCPASTAQDGLSGCKSRCLLTYSQGAHPGDRQSTTHQITRSDGPGNGKEELQSRQNADFLPIGLPQALQLPKSLQTDNPLPTLPKLPNPFDSVHLSSSTNIIGHTNDESHNTIGAQKSGGGRLSSSLQSIGSPTSFGSLMTGSGISAATSAASTMLHGVGNAVSTASAARQQAVSSGLQALTSAAGSGGVFTAPEPLFSRPGLLSPVVATMLPTVPDTAFHKVGAGPSTSSVPAPARSQLPLQASTGSIASSFAQGLSQPTSGWVFNGGSSTSASQPPNVTDMKGLTEGRGYHMEQHDLVTSDGYFLVNFRIPHGKGKAANASLGPPVLLIHGISLSSTCWVVNSPDQSLAFILADKGFDVWMMNTRGNSFSRGHVRYGAQDPRYWAFAIDEMALIDLSATIDNILSTTGRKKVAIVGHSQGGTLPLMLLSRHPEYNERVNINIGLAAVVFVKYMTSPTMVAFSQAASNSNIASLVPPQQYAPMSESSQLLFLNGACQTIITAPACVAVTQSMFGPSTHITTSQYMNYWHVWPSSTSYWNALQWAQMYNDAATRLSSFNLAYVYDLTLIKAPCYMISGGQDVLAPPQAMDQVHQKLGGRLVGSHRVADYGHMDFIWDADGAHEILYPLIATILHQYAVEK
ncbi:hypothetical protein CEUSTIGMA_g323.t1 [Chlamydomonas eustigma]|uniref:AB hydrolase-1 domain-containing protein n=1 Tax=Chlamydomonas eustigma TaxID=1157962 RepID=A0A250WPW3_9CHLO|nr:hypothetical protein CEUSTIGMA_g323.t1 [Chlamydomonas eustigma]|eukprot:GAX72868.1 hypothetical protein CEUSTIGMA_g323.t1 [Chlamydomonas eustigma]